MSVNAVSRLEAQTSGRYGVQVALTQPFALLFGVKDQTECFRMWVGKHDAFSGIRLPEFQ